MLKNGLSHRTMMKEEEKIINHKKKQKSNQFDER